MEKCLKKVYFTNSVFGIAAQVSRFVFIVFIKFKLRLGKGHIEG